MNPINELRLPRMGIGCAYLTAGSLTHYDQRLIQAMVEEGAYHFDVAPQYGLGTAEKVLGEAISSFRNEVSITTKAGIVRPNVPNWKILLRALLAPVRDVARKYRKNSNLQSMNVERNLNFEPAFILHSLEDSLKNLKTDRVEIFLLHMVTLEDITEELIQALEAQKRQGKILAFGLATERSETEKILEKWPNTFDVIQHSWSVLDEPLLATDKFRITHRALARAMSPLHNLIVDDQLFKQRLSNYCDVDFSNPSILSQALLGAALFENQNGLILAASHSIQRSKENLRVAKDPATIEMGRSLIQALRKESNLPMPKL